MSITKDSLDSLKTQLEKKRWRLSEVRTRFEADGSIADETSAYVNNNLKGVILNIRTSPIDVPRVGVFTSQAQPLAQHNAAFMNPDVLFAFIEDIEVQLKSTMQKS